MFILFAYEFLFLNLKVIPFFVIKNKKRRSVSKLYFSNSILLFPVNLVIRDGNEVCFFRYLPHLVPDGMSLKFK